MNTLPVVLAVTPVAFVDTGKPLLPIVPLPEDKVSARAVPLIVLPLASVMFPDPSAATVTVGAVPAPVTLASRKILPLLPVAVFSTTPLPDTPLATVRLPVLVTWNVCVLPALEVPEIVTAVVSVTVTLPVVLAIKLGDVIVISPISPLLAVKVTVPVGEPAMTMPPV
jgi:hypothetical protein